MSAAVTLTHSYALIACTGPNLYLEIHHLSTSVILENYLMPQVQNHNDGTMIFQ